MLDECFRGSLRVIDVALCDGRAAQNQLTHSTNRNKFSMVVLIGYPEVDSKSVTHIARVAARNDMSTRSIENGTFGGAICVYQVALFAPLRDVRG
jgi:F420-0:gamma-glutamyl ligase